MAGGRITVAHFSWDGLASVPRRSLPLPPPEDPVEVAGIPIAYSAGHLVDFHPRLPKQCLRGLKATARQKPLE